MLARRPELRETGSGFFFMRGNWGQELPTPHTFQVQPPRRDSSRQTYKEAVSSFTTLPPVNTSNSLPYHGIDRSYLPHAKLRNGCFIIPFYRTP